MVFRSISFVTHCKSQAQRFVACTTLVSFAEYLEIQTSSRLWFGNCMIACSQHGPVCLRLTSLLIRWFKLAFYLYRRQKLFRLSPWPGMRRNTAGAMAGYPPVINPGLWAPGWRQWRPMSAIPSLLMIGSFRRYREGVKKGLGVGCYQSVKNAGVFREKRPLIE